MGIHGPSHLWLGLRATPTRPRALKKLRLSQPLCETERRADPLGCDICIRVEKAQRVGCHCLVLPVSPLCLSLSEIVRDQFEPGGGSPLFRQLSLIFTVMHFHHGFLASRKGGCKGRELMRGLSGRWQQRVTFSQKSAFPASLLPGGRGGALGGRAASELSPKQRSQAASFLPNGETLKKLKPGNFIICNTL